MKRILKKILCKLANLARMIDYSNYMRSEYGERWIDEIKS